MKIVTGDSVPSFTERVDWKGLVAQADEVLGESHAWALLTEGYKHATATTLLRLRHPGWNFVARKNPDGGYDYWAQKNGASA